MTAVVELIEFETTHVKSSKTAFSITRQQRDLYSINAQEPRPSDLATMSAHSILIPGILCNACCVARRIGVAVPVDAAERLPRKLIGCQERFAISKDLINERK